VGFAAAFTVLLVWWQLLRPSNDRIWADDVAQMMTGTLDERIDIITYRLRTASYFFRLVKGRFAVSRNSEAPIL
jgi:hypothetical protein